jgi:alkylation response protein AidB-like acyl-CoA dehydrogenase
MVEMGLTRLAAPRRFGGLQLPMKVQTQIFTELARGDVSTAWVCSIYAAVHQIAAQFPEEAQEEYFLGENSRSAGVFSSIGAEAKVVAGGFEVSGRFPFCSGQHHAGWIMVPAPLVPGADNEIRLFQVPRSEFEKLDDWNVTGFSGTGSNTMRLNGVFVPEHRSVPFHNVLEANPLSARAAADPYYRQPVMAQLVAGAAGPILGSAQEAYELFMDRIGTRGITYTNYSRQADAPITHHQVAEARMTLDHATFHTDRLADTIDYHVANEDAKWDVETRVRCKADLAWTLKLSRTVCEIVASASGANAIRTTDRLPMILKDIRAISTHALALYETNNELYGRVLAGLEPNTPAY